MYDIQPITTPSLRSTTDTVPLIQPTTLHCVLTGKVHNIESISPSPRYSTDTGHDVQQNTPSPRSTTDVVHYIQQITPYSRSTTDADVVHDI